MTNTLEEQMQYLSDLEFPFRREGSIDDLTLSVENFRMSSDSREEEALVDLVITSGLTDQRPSRTTLFVKPADPEGLLTALSQFANKFEPDDIAARAFYYEKYQPAPRRTLYDCLKDAKASQAVYSYAAACLEKHLEEIGLSLE